MKKGFSAAKISEMLKSNNLDNAPSQSLISVINGILDERIETENAEIPQSVACLLRKIVQEIDRRIVTQAEHLRTQSNLFKAREEKYQSRIHVLEALAKGSNETIAMNHLQRHAKSEKEKYDKEELEIDIKTETNLENRLKEQETGVLEASALKEELEMAKKAHELHSLKLETEAQMLKSRLSLQDQLLEDSKVKIKELQTKTQSLIQKQRRYQIFGNIQLSALKELRHSSEAIKQEMLKTQKTYLEELNHVGTKLNKLAKAAQSYHQVLNDNRKLYNELQDLKGNIRVYCRMRPLTPWENQKQTIIENIGENGELTVTNPTKPKDAQKSFKFNKVYGPMATQAEVFSDTQPLIRTILDGYNVCIFAYGQTGSGKTYTMSGPDHATKDDWGVNYRALDYLFQISEDRKSFFSYEIGVQMIEIYNEQIRDLLSTDGSQKKLGIVGTPQPHGLAVPDASMLPVQSTEDVIELMNIGLTNRSVGATAMNESSSRSHSVVTIHVQGTDLKSGATSHGILHLVDLAGSERVDRSEATGDRLKEAQHINKSLSALGDVIFSLAQKNPHVPYRNSKLTQLLHTSLGGRAKTLMFVQVNPDLESFTESLSTLKFAERVSGVELGAARSSKEGKDVKDLMDQVVSLKDIIAKKDAEIERLQMDPKTPNSRRSLISLKNGPSSPSAKSRGSSPQQSPTISSFRRIGARPKSASEQDNLSSFSDNNLHAIYQHENEVLRSSRSMCDLNGSGSEVSDSDLSVETDDGTFQGSSLHQATTSSETTKNGNEKLRTPKRASQPSRLSSGASRMAPITTNSKLASASKKLDGGNASPCTPARQRRMQV